MKFVAIQGRVLKTPLSRTTRTGQLMCCFPLIGEPALDWPDFDVANAVRGSISVACWGEVGTAALTLRADDYLLVFGRVSGYRRLASGDDSSADTLAVDAVALGLDLAGERRDVGEVPDRARMLTAQRRMAAMAVHPAGRGRYADAPASPHELPTAIHESTACAARPTNDEQQVTQSG